MGRRKPKLKHQCPSCGRIENLVQCAVAWGMIRNGMHIEVNSILTYGGQSHGQSS